LLRSTAFAAAAIASGAFATAALSADNEEKWSYAESSIYFTLNHNDGELVLMSEVESDGWHRLTIDGPGKDRLLDIRIDGRMKDQGLTEIVIESTGDDEPKDGMFKRFPEGEYLFGGMTTDGKKIRADSKLSHVMPAPPPNLKVSGQPVPMECEEGSIPMASLPVTISWDPVTQSHPKVGVSGPVDIRNYMLEVERRRPTKVEMKVELSSKATSFQLPGDFATKGSDEKYKFKIAVVNSGGNATEFEGCFKVKAS
jgi:hypothetical protein